MKQNVLCGILVLSLLAGACGGSDPTGTNDSQVESNYTQVSEQDFDGVTPVRVTTEGLGLALSPVLMGVEAGELDWRMEFESNRPLDSLVAYDVDGHPLRVELQDAYHGKLWLDRQQLAGILAREALYLEILARGGERLVYSAVVRLRPRVLDPAGSLLIWVDGGMSSALVGREVRFSGFATTASRINSLSVVTDNDADPVTRSLSRTRWGFTWSTMDLLRAMEAEGRQLHLLGRDDEQGEHRVSAGLQVVVEGLGLTTGHAMREWPADDCQVVVQRCLNTLPRRDQQDTSVCGNAADVLACGQLPR